jgi:putative transposase
MVISLYPNKTQERIMLQTIGHCCFLYNHLLEYCNKAYAEMRKHPSEYDLNHEITGFKKEHPELRTVYSQVLQNVSTRVSLAYKGFFKRLGS